MSGMHTLMRNQQLEVVKQINKSSRQQDAVAAPSWFLSGVLTSWLICFPDFTDVMQFVSILCTVRNTYFTLARKSKEEEVRERIRNKVLPFEMCMLILIYFTLPKSTSVGEYFDKSSDLEKPRPAPFPRTLSQAVDSPPAVSTLAKTRATLRICHGLFFSLPLPNYHWQMIFTFPFSPALGENSLAESPGAKKQERKKKKKKNADSRQQCNQAMLWNWQRGK